MAERDTMSSRAYDGIREAILDGTFAVGGNLVVRRLIDELGLSATPIKVALAALAREGLVVALPRRGYFVATFELDDIREICALRAALDRLAAELAATQPHHRALARELDVTIKSQRAAVRSGDITRYADLNMEFHSAIWTASNNRRLIQAADNLFGQIRLLVPSSASISGRPAHAVAEHAEIAKALRAGDAVVVGRLALEHARRSEDALVERFSGRADYS
ncbi:MAG: GntR family transcriptional regulator [Nakamurella sp.]